MCRHFNHTFSQRDIHFWASTSDRTWCAYVVFGSSSWQSTCRRQSTWRASAIDACGCGHACHRFLWSTASTAYTLSSCYISWSEDSAFWYVYSTGRKMSRFCGLNILYLLALQSRPSIGLSSLLLFRTSEHRYTRGLPCCSYCFVPYLNYYVTFHLKICPMHLCLVGSREELLLDHLSHVYHPKAQAVLADLDLDSVASTLVPCLILHHLYLRR